MSASKIEIWKKFFFPCLLGFYHTKKSFSICEEMRGWWQWVLLFSSTAFFWKWLNLPLSGGRGRAGGLIVKQENWRRTLVSRSSYLQIGEGISPFFGSIFNRMDDHFVKKEKRRNMVEVCIGWQCYQGFGDGSWNKSPFLGQFCQIFSFFIPP